MDTSDIGTSTSRRGRRGAATPVQHEAGGNVVLGPRDSLVGTLSVEGDVHIEGSVEGEVTATGEVNVHSAGTARAKIEARDIVIDGAVDGSVVARDRVSIGESATLSGELQSSRLRVDEGATVNATIAMSARGEAPPARRADRHESDEHSVDVTGSPAGTASETSSYGEGGDGSASDDAGGVPETSAVFSGAESEEG